MSDAGAAAADGSQQLAWSDISTSPELLGDPVTAFVAGWPHAGQLQVAAIDPGLSDTAEFCRVYGVPAASSANCVVVSGSRAGESRYAACLVLATDRADVNGVVRRLLDVRKASMAPMDEAVRLTGMECGGITPIGLPVGWPIYLAAEVLQAGPVVIGSGLRRSKLQVDGALLATLPGAEVIDNLSRR